MDSKIVPKALQGGTAGETRQGLRGAGMGYLVHDLALNTRFCELMRLSSQWVSGTLDDLRTTSRACLQDCCATLLESVRDAHQELVRHPRGERGADLGRIPSELLVEAAKTNDPADLEDRLYMVAAQLHDRKVDPRGSFCAVIEEITETPVVWGSRE